VREGSSAGGDSENLKLRKNRFMSRTLDWDGWVRVVLDFRELDYTICTKRGNSICWFHT